MTSIGLSKVVDARPVLKPENSAKKVIVTDLDFTFWHGVLGEDGSDGIRPLIGITSVIDCPPDEHFK